MGHPDILPNCTDYFLDFSVLARVQRSAQAVEVVAPQLLAVGGSRAPSDAQRGAHTVGGVVKCVQTPMNGAFRRVMRGDSRIEDELAHESGEVRACSDAAFDVNASAPLYIAGETCETTRWAGADTLTAPLLARAHTHTHTQTHTNSTHDG